MIIYITGIQGGVGKSFTTFLALNEYRDEKPIIIETETDNTNLFKAVCKEETKDGKFITKDDIEFYKIDTDTGDGWYQITEIALNNINRPIIINSPARNKQAIDNYGTYFNDLKDAKIDVVTLFVISNKQDSINHLGDYLDIIDTRICVVKNQGTDRRMTFELFDNSSYNNIGIPSVLIKNSPNVIQNEIFNQRKLISELLEDGRPAMRIAIKQYLEQNTVIKNAVKAAVYYNDLLKKEE